MIEKFGKGADAGIFGDRTESEEFNRDILIPWQQLRPKEMDFVGVYPVEEIMKDLDDVKKKKNNPEFVKGKTEESMVSEYALPYLIEDEQIWGDADVSVSMTSEFDDIMRGTDFVIRYNIDGQDFYMGIDVKTNMAGSHDYRVEKSISQIVEAAKKGRLNTIKYFKDLQEDGDGRKKSLEIPVAVIVFKNNKILPLRDILPIHPKKRSESQKRQLEEIKTKLNQELKDNCREMIQLVQALITSSSDKPKEKIIGSYKNFLRFLDSLE
ncbi:MAG: hypothetical protein V1928_02645 [Parcubacteria group bacterium]